MLRVILKIAGTACFVAGIALASGHVFLTMHSVGIGIGISAVGAVLSFLAHLIHASGSGSEVALPVVRAEDWDELRRTADDPHTFPESFAEWCEEHDRVKDGLRGLGQACVEVPIDLAALSEWCTERGKRNTAATRARFAEELHRAKKQAEAQANRSTEPS